LRYLNNFSAPALRSIANGCFHFWRAASEPINIVLDFDSPNLERVGNKCFIFTIETTELMSTDSVDIYFRTSGPITFRGTSMDASSNPQSYRVHVKEINLNAASSYFKG